MSSKPTDDPGDEVASISYRLRPTDWRGFLKMMATIVVISIAPPVVCGATAYSVHLVVGRGWCPVTTIPDLPFFLLFVVVTVGGYRVGWWAMGLYNDARRRRRGGGR